MMSMAPNWRVLVHIKSSSAALFSDQQVWKIQLHSCRLLWNGINSFRAESASSGCSGWMWTHKSVRPFSLKIVFKVPSNGLLIHSKPASNSGKYLPNCEWRPCRCSLKAATLFCSALNAVSTSSSSLAARRKSVRDGKLCRMALLRIHAPLFPSVFQSSQLHRLCKCQHILSSRGWAAQWNHWVSQKWLLLWSWWHGTTKKKIIMHSACINVPYKTQQICLITDISGLIQLEWEKLALAFSCLQLIFNILSHTCNSPMDSVIGQPFNLITCFLPKQYVSHNLCSFFKFSPFEWGFPVLAFIRDTLYEASVAFTFSPGAKKLWGSSSCVSEVHHVSSQKIL